MYIYPNTTLHILRNVSLNSDYDHTIYFQGKVEQTEYFLSKIKYTLSNQSYQRKERGWIQVNINQNDLWDCTYLMYQNTTHHNKWFYAFILSVEYINEGVSKINFEIDVIQTWHFDYVLDKCFVEREHSEDDEMFKHTIPENIDIGISRYIATNSDRELFNNNRLLIITTSDQYNNAASPRMEANVFTGLRYRTFDLSDTSAQGGRYLALDFLSRIIAGGWEDNVVAVMQYPDFIGQLESDVDGYVHIDKRFVPNLTDFRGYYPKNNKLFCYPYNYMIISDKEGNSKEYKWELWGNDELGNSQLGAFTLEGCGFGKPIMQIVPRYYKTSNYVLNYDEAITYDNFPFCAWPGDSYQVWLAQNKNQTIWRGISGAVGGGVTAGVGLATGRYDLTAYGLSDLFGATTNALAKHADATNLPKPAHGNISSSLINIQNGSSGFEIKQMIIPPEYAQIIDEYFSRYGYACCRIKIPNRNARLNWTYTKTVGCEISGNIPSDDCVKIKAVYDHGITFWKNKNNLVIGDYGDFTNPTYGQLNIANTGRSGEMILGEVQSV